MSYWLDYSAAKLSGQTIRAAGYSGVIRYIDSPGNLGRKHTDRLEYQSHLAAGLGVQLVMQTTTSASDGGAPVGRDHAIRARDGMDYLGYSGLVYFTNDRPTLPSSQRWDDYLTAACDVLGPSRVGAYGFANAMDVARNQTPVTAFWLAGSQSGIASRPYLNFWQDNNTQVTVGGITCDRNLVLGDDVALTADDVARIATAVGNEMKYKVLAGDWRFEPGNRNPLDMLQQAVASGFATGDRLDSVLTAVASVVAKLDVVLARPDVSGVTKDEIRELLRELRLVVGA